jgi:small subunit ribosomal protein S26e
MPISTAPYKREYRHTDSRGAERLVRCDSCGRTVPRYKTFTKVRGMHLGDPALMRQVDRRMIHMMQRVERYCPGCARSKGIVQPGKSTRKKYGGRMH